MKRPVQDISLIEWLGFDAKPNLLQARKLGYLLGFLLLILAMGFVFLGLSVVFEFANAVFQTQPYENDTKGEAIRNVGLVLAAFLGAPFVIWRTVVAAKQAEISDEALFNDKISDAAKDLSSRIFDNGSNTVSDEIAEQSFPRDDLVARMSALDRLEGLALERKHAAPRIARLIAAYIRTNFPATNLMATKELSKPIEPRIDLQRAVDAIGRVNRISIDVYNSYNHLDLRKVNFDGVSFKKGDFTAVNFSSSRFEACQFQYTNFEGAIFSKSLLNYAVFSKTNLKGAKFHFVEISLGGDFINFSSDVEITGLSLIGANISAISYFGGPKRIELTFGDLGTVLSEELMDTRPSENEFRIAHGLLNNRAETAMNEQEKELVGKLKASGFQNWSPYRHPDMAVGVELKKHYQNHGLLKWPYWE